ncbi:MAG: Na+:solute symporter [Vicinamibacteria bacterium]|nr:Na+:solute symporter [Vicinamibacteria bacterium]
MKLHPIDVGVIVVYFMAMLAIGVAVMKRASKSMDSYFLAGNKLPWWILGVSNASAMWDITGTMWLVYNLFVYGLKGTWLPWLWPTFNQVILMIYLASWVRRSGVLTGAEWITTRFGAGRGGELSRVIIVIFALVSVVGFVAYDFAGMGKFSKTFLPWDLSPNTYAVIVMSITAIYVLLGGMISVVITDLAQFIIMALCAVIVAGIAMVRVSGAEAAALLPAGWENISFGWKMDLDWSHLIPALTQNMVDDGYGWFGLFFVAMLLKGVFISIAGPAPNYDMQRVLAARTPREASFMSAVVSAALFPRWILVAGITLLGVKFLSPHFAAQAGKVDFEMVLPYVISHFIPVGVIGLLLAGLLAAFMSTFSATLNAGGAYLVNDLYKRYVKKDASAKHYVVASYVAQAAILVLGFGFGLMASSVNQATQWIVNYLWGGYTAANVLKWHWHRFNGFGYFWGMMVGLGAVAVVPLLVPQSGLGSLGGFAIIFVASLFGCVLGSLLTAPEDDEILKKFYKQVRPWGFWGPIHELVVKEDPKFERNKSFPRDMLNCGVAILWQIPLCVIPIYAVFRDWEALWISIGVFLVASFVLKRNWLDKLGREDALAVARPGA